MPYTDYLKTLSDRNLELKKQVVARQYKKSTPQTKLAEAEKKIEEVKEPARNDAGFFKRLAHSLGDLGGNVVGGLAKGVEGVVDYGAGLAGGIGGLFGAKDFQNDVKDFISKDYAGQYVTNPINDYFSESMLKDGGILESVAQGVGQMLPSIALTAATGGVAGTALFMAGAAGGGMEEAFNLGADYNQALAYGTASGVIEGLVEKASGGIGGSKAGQLLGRQMGKTAFGRLGATVVGEGLEEVTSDLLNPLLKRATGVDKNATVDVEQLPKTFIVGGLTGAVLGGGQQTVQAVKNNNIGGMKAVNAAQGLETYNEIGKDINIKQAEGKLTEKELARATKDRSDYLDSVSKQLQKMSPEKRSAFIEKMKLEKTFDASGQKIETNTNTNVNREAMSASLWDRADSLTYKPTSSELTDEQKQAVNNAIKLKDGNVNVVITDDLRVGINGLKRDNVLYISKNANAAQTVAAHEVTHTLEATKEYDKLKDFVRAMPDYEQKLNAYKELYSKVNTEFSEKTKLYEAETELIADFMGQALSSKEAVDRVVKHNKGIGYRVYNWIRQKLSGKTNSAQNAVYTQAEKLYAKALKTAYGGMSLEDIDKLYKKYDERDKAKQTAKSTKQNAATVKAEGARYAAAMYHNKADSLETFYEFVSENRNNELEKNKSYFDYVSPKGTIIRVPFERAAHAQKDHNLSAKEFTSIVRALDNINEYSIGKKGQGAYNGTKIFAKVKVGNKTAGVVLETLPNGRIFEDTVFFDKSERISEWIKKNGSHVLSSDNKVVGSSSMGNHSIDIILQEIKKVNPENEKNTRFSLSDTNKTKLEARASKDVVYKKKEAEAIINELAADFTLKGKVKENVINELFVALNTAKEGRKIESALKIADYIINNAVLENIYSMQDVQEIAKDQISIIRDYVGKMDLTSIASEIESRFDKNGARGIMLSWGQKSGKKGKYAPSQIAQELRDSGININTTSEADIFFEIKDLYDNAKKQLRAETKAFLKDALVYLVETSANPKRLAINELRALDVITSGIIHLYKTYDSFFQPSNKGKR